MFITKTVLSISDKLMYFKFKKQNEENLYSIKENRSPVWSINVAALVTAQINFEKC